MPHSLFEDGSTTIIRCEGPPRTVFSGANGLRLGVLHARRSAAVGPLHVITGCSAGWYYFEIAVWTSSGPGCCSDSSSAAQRRLFHGTVSGIFRSVHLPCIQDVVHR
jgi:hypothetical protein